MLFLEIAMESTLYRRDDMTEFKEIQISRSGIFEILGEDGQMKHKEFRSEEELLKALPSFAGKPIYDRKDLHFATNEPEGKIIGTVSKVSLTSSGEVVAQISVDDEQAIKELSNEAKIVKTAYKCNVSPSDVEGCLYNQIDLDVSFCWLTSEGRYE